MKNGKKKPKARKTIPQEFPQGWDEERVRKVLTHYENQSEDEAVAEDEAAYNADGQTVMIVPTECPDELVAECTIDQAQVLARNHLRTVRVHDRSWVLHYDATISMSDGERHAVKITFPTSSLYPVADEEARKIIKQLRFRAP